MHEKYSAYLICFFNSKHIGIIIIAEFQMPTKTQNMGNLFPIKETSKVITISFTANVKVRIWGL